MDTIEFKNLLKAGTILVMVLIAYLVINGISALEYLKVPVTSGNTIVVSGHGDAYAVPDIATFSFSVSADAKTVSDAQKQVTDKVDAILSAIKAAGVDEKDIKTTDYNVYPKYVYSTAPCSPNYCPPSRQTQDGFTATHGVTVKVRKTEDAGKLLGIAGEKGATNLSGISFTVDDQEKINNDARSAAISDAKAKAQELAKQLGVRLGKVVSFEENNNGGYPVPMYASQALGKGADSAAVAPTLPTGENKVTVDVNVTYEIH